MSEARDGIEILDMEHTESYVFRVVRMEQGCCKESLPCRVELGPKGFTIAFYGPHGLRDAKFGVEPLRAVPVELADLVAVAIKQAAKLENEWLEKLQSK